MEFGSNKDKDYSGECLTTSERDRLSELPDEVLVHILSFLPTLDAVRTVLLRRFGHLWTLVPNLEFDELDVIKGLGLLNNTRRFESLPFVDSRLCLLIRKVLSLYRRPTIDKFLFYVVKGYNSVIKKTAVDEIGVRVRFALSREVKELVLCLGVDHDYVTVPASVFTSQSIVVLQLKKCRIELPSEVHMGSLKRLKFVWVDVDDDNFNKFVSCCPSLQEIVVNNTLQPRVFSFYSPGIEKLELSMDQEYEPTGFYRIDCPYLKILNLDVYFEDVVVVNVPSVRKVTINAFSYLGEMEAHPHHFRRFLERFQNAEVMTLKGADEALSCWRLNVGFPQTRWKRVVLESSLEEVHVAGICCLVRNSPCLEELIIHVLHSWHSERVEMVNDSNFVAPRLKFLSIHGYQKPNMGQLPLAESLLKSAANLEKLVIFFNQNSQFTSADELQFIKQLLNFPRASAKARIEVNGNCKN